MKNIKVGEEGSICQCKRVLLVIGEVRGASTIRSCFEYQFSNSVLFDYGWQIYVVNQLI